ncbi:MAG: Shedu anti-phage system protein SduA domain-containing protein [Spirulinaceae cyanobacterium]
MDIFQDPNLTKKYITHLNHYAFTQFVTELFNQDLLEQGMTEFRPFPDIGDDTFYQPYLDSYGESIHRVFLIHTPPLELFDPTREFNIDDPILLNRLARIRNHYKNCIGRWGKVDPYLEKDDALKTVGFLLNIADIDQLAYQDFLFPAYKRVKKFCGLKKPYTLLGSADSFVEKSPTSTGVALERTLRKIDGISILIDNNGIKVREFSNERWLGSGVVKSTRSPYEPIFLNKAIHGRSILCAFESLLNSEPSESELEDFLVTYYKDVFGYKYDRIEAQLWLRFPDLDISGKDRRLDVFLRNSVSNDWELFEIKRPIRLTRTYRDAPTFSSEVHHSIQQVKNYARILSKDEVKKHFVKQGIEYFEPCLNLVVGRTPQMPHEQFRWLQSSGDSSVKILTFDNLVSELKCRLSERYAMLKDMYV